MLIHFIRYTAAILIAALLQGCGGGSTGSGSTTALVGSAATVSGVAATGAAMDGIVTLKDSTGTTRTASISQPSGTFSMDVTGLTPPYFLKATNNAGTLTLYSVATSSGTFNINPLSNLVAVAAAMSIDPLAKSPDEAFNNPANFSTLTAAQIQAATDSVMAQMSPAFQAALAANGASSVNPLTDSFQTGNGLDKVFDGFVVTLNTATGEVQEHQVASNTTTVLGLVDKLGTFSAAGIYDGTVDTTQSGGGIHQVHDMLITPSGEMRYVMDNGVIVIAALTASGSTVIGTGKAYAPTLNGQPVNFQFADGSTTAINLTINGTLGTGTLSGTYTYGNYTDTFSFSLNTQQTNSTAALDKIAGTYASSLDSNTVFIGHIEANGNIWGSGPGIGYSGLIQVVDPNANIYRVTLAYLQNGTVGYVSGLATFHDVAPATVFLPMPTALVPADYTGEIASLSYSPSTSGGQGELVMLLSSPSQQISLGAVRMSSQQQTIAVQPTSNSLMVQAVGNPAFLVTTVSDIQYSSSAAIVMYSGSMNASGNINVITNPGNIGLNGPNMITVQLTQTGVPITISGSVCAQTSAGGITTPPAGTLIITANPVCKTYDGTAYSGGNGVAYYGFVNGDTPAMVGGTLTYGGTSQGAKNVGTYTIIPSGLTSSDYNITYVNSTLTISPASLTVTANNTSHIYDSNTVGGLVGYSAGTITNGYVSGGSVSEVYSVGGLTGNNSGSVALSGASASNYAVSNVGTLVINGATAIFGLASTGTTSSGVTLSADP